MEWINGERKRVRIEMDGKMVKNLLKIEKKIEIVKK